MKPLKLFLDWVGLSLAGIGLAYLFLYLSKDFSAPASTLHFIFITAALLALFILLWLSWQNAKTWQQHLNYLSTVIIRCTLASLFVFYALGKVYDLQFATDPAWLKKTAGELSKFESAWLFFGQSYNYGLFLAITQILTAILLLFRPTATAGALLFAGIMGNIVLINLEYGVVYMQETALLLLAMAIYLVQQDYRRVLQFVLGRASSAIALPSNPRLEWLGWAIGLISAATHWVFFAQISAAR